MLDDIYNAEYSVGLYTSRRYISSTITDQLCNYTQYQQYCLVWDTVNLMIKCSKYQIAPFGLKSKNWYTTDQITDLATDDGFTKWVTYDDIPFHTALSTTGLSIDESFTSIGSFKFYHMNGAHMPYLMTKNFTYTDRDDYDALLSQAKGSMKIVFEYIEQLKALDMYDNTTIIITADHGENYLYDPGKVSILENLKMNKTSNPILLVKNAHQTWEGVKQNSAPVSPTEVVADIVAAINPQAAVNYGSTLEDIEESADRDRIYIFTRSDLPYVKAVINGDVLDEENWTVVETVPMD